MYNILVKLKQYKQFWFSLIKLSIVFGAGFFIYHRLRTNKLWESKVVFEQIDTLYHSNKGTLFLLLSMSVLNWIFEIIKWKNLVKNIESISFYRAFSQSLSAHTLSLITPFKAGEYGGKALYFPKTLRNKVMALNLIGNLTQLLVTLTLGLVGLYYFITHFNVSINPPKIRRIGYVVAFIILSFFTGKKLIKSGYYQRAISFFLNLDWQIKFKTLFYSFIRYLLFSHQFYLLLLLFGTNTPYITAMMLIFSLYFIATMVPVLSLFDFLIKGSIAIYLFSFVPVNEMIILLISTLLWLLNFALPALIGSYFVLIFKPNYKTI